MGELKSSLRGLREEDGGIWVQEGKRVWKSRVVGPCMPCDRKERESNRMHCTVDFFPLCLSPFFVSLSFFPAPSPPPRPFSFVPPPAFTHRKIKTNYFIVSLAFVDLLVSVLVMPFGAIELVQDIWIYGEMFCLVRTSLDVLLTTASIFHLCCISLDR